MNKIQPLDQVSAIVAEALNQAAKVRKNFKSFFTEAMILILTIYGRVSFLSMARHGDSCESRFRQNFKKKAHEGQARQPDSEVSQGDIRP